MPIEIHSPEKKNVMLLQAPLFLLPLLGVFSATLAPAQDLVDCIPTNTTNTLYLRGPVQTEESVDDVEVNCPDGTHVIHTIKTVTKTQEVTVQNKQLQVDADTGEPCPPNIHTYTYTETLSVHEEFIEGDLCIQDHHCCIQVSLDEYYEEFPLPLPNVETTTVPITCPDGDPGLKTITTTSLGKYRRKVFKYEHIPVNDCPEDCQDSFYYGEWEFVPSRSTTTTEDDCRG